jgi:hypothetical protein
MAAPPNPYRRTRRAANDDAADGDTVARPTGLMIAAILEGWTALYAAYSAPETLREFAVLFKGFGADLPKATKLILAAPYAWWPLAVIGIAMAIWIIARPRITPAEHRRMKIAVRVYGVVLGIAFAFGAYAIYLPLFKLGAVV